MDGTARSRTTISLARRAASLVLAAVALGGPAAADAAELALDEASATAAADVAKSYWQATPCAGQVAITWTALAPTTNATSSWANPIGAYDAPEQNSACAIDFNSALEWDWTRFCSILVHEYGHLAGHPHGTDAGDVMYPYYVKPVAQCEAAAAGRPATAPALVAEASSLPGIETPAAEQPRRAKVKRAVLVVVREPRKLRGRQMHPKRHRTARHKRVRMHRARA
jgi:hypothetical protein